MQDGSLSCKRRKHRKTDTFRTLVSCLQFSLPSWDPQYNCLATIAPTKSAWLPADTVHCPKVIAQDKAMPDETWLHATWSRRCPAFCFTEPAKYPRRIIIPSPLLLSSPHHSHLASLKLPFHSYQSLTPSVPSTRRPRLYDGVPQVSHWDGI